MKDIESRIPPESLPEVTRACVEGRWPEARLFLSPPNLTRIGGIIKRVWAGSDGVHYRHPMEPEIGLWNGGKHPSPARLLGQTCVGPHGGSEQQDEGQEGTRPTRPRPYYWLNFCFS